MSKADNLFLSRDKDQLSHEQEDSKTIPTQYKYAVLVRGSGYTLLTLECVCLTWFIWPDKEKLNPHTDMYDLALSL